MSIPCARRHGYRAHALDGNVDVLAIAEVGLLCGDCFHRLAYRLDDAPPIIRAARAAVVPDIGGGGDSEPVSGTKEKRLPFDAAALETADDLFASLANWTITLARTLTVDPPVELGRTFDADGDVRGLAARSTPAAAEEMAEGAVRWLLTHLEAAAALPVVVDLYDDVVPAIERAHGRWGESGTKTRQSQVACPACGDSIVRIAWTGFDATAWCAECLLGRPVDWTALT